MMKQNCNNPSAFIIPNPKRSNEALIYIELQVLGSNYSVSLPKMKDSFKNSIIKSVNIKLKEPKMMSLSRVATGRMDRMNNNTFRAIFKTSEVAFNSDIKTFFRLENVFITSLRPGGMDFRNAFVIRISAIDEVRNNKLKLMTHPVYKGLDVNIVKLNMMFFSRMQSFVWSPFLSSLYFVFILAHLNFEESTNSDLIGLLKF